jgi:hypothetical protein
MFPILEAMEPELLSHEWLKSAAETMAGLYLELEGAALMVDNVYVVICAYFIENTMINVISSETSTLKKPTLVHVRSIGRVGRPRTEISPDWLRESMSPGRRISFEKLAELAGVHRNTLRFYLKKHGVYERFCALSDADLDILVKTFKSTKPSSGLTYMIGFLRSHGL